MGYKVDFKNVEEVGLETSPVAPALAGLRANEARYFWNKFKHEFVTEPASEHPDIIAYVNEVLSERDLEIQATPLEVSQFEVEGVKWTYVFLRRRFVDQRALHTGSGWQARCGL